ncbi:hypothetical protein E4T44_08224 [Aureobasidium sp. EXF-8845]|nr:hypothetical protein E4T44_08224 [Aureobasidium sp. EXF-8845]KAI4844506.1 hypothetical protein E4T45_08128 [Aureobasidium sp. EXF-8846]
MSEEARLSIAPPTPLLESTLDTKTSMRKTSKVKQSRLKRSRLLFSQSKHTAANTRRLGEPRSIAPITSTSVTRIGSAFATFNFRYRSRNTILNFAEDLQISCLISRSPSPIPLEDRPEDSLTREELLELLRRQKADREEMIKIKQELKRERIEDDEGDDDLIIISSRPPTRKLKITADGSTGIEAVDLTDD